MAGELIVCAIVKDTFDSANCPTEGIEASICDSRRTVFAEEGKMPSLTDASAREMATAERLWETLRPRCRLEEVALARDSVLSGRPADNGRAVGKAKALPALAVWNACPAEGLVYLDR